jgi:peptidoglycan/LPS O-acetylase OafA/YrhL
VEVSRPANPPRHVAELDGVRGLVTLGVALFHIQLAVAWTPNHELWRAMRESWFFSIEFLFILGGLVAFLPVARSGRLPDWRAYALRRAGRVLPLYYLTLLLALVLGGELREVSGAHYPHDFSAVVAHLVFLHHEVLPVRVGFGVHGIVWTMSIVVLFWVLFPVLARVWLRFPLAALAAALAVTAGWHLVTADDLRLLLQFPAFAAAFGIGMTAAWSLVRLWPLISCPRAPAVALLAAGAALLALLAGMYASGVPIARGEATYWGEGPLLALAVPLAFAAAVVALPFCPRPLRALFTNRPVRFLGEISYGFFLFHFLVIWSVLALVDIPRDGRPSSVLALAAIVLPATALAAWLGTVAVERPVRAWLRGRSERPRPAARPKPSAQPAKPGPLRDVYVPAFDGVRAAITLSVALVHVQRASGWWPNHEFPSAIRHSMFFSVEFLFLVGGFVAFLPLVYFGRLSVRSFALRRAGRILPLYWVTLVAAVVLWPYLSGPAAATAPPELGEFAVHLLFLHHIVYPFASGFGVQGIVWTMTVVVAFWVLYPFVARAYARHPFAGLAVAIAVVVGWRQAFADQPSVLLQPPLFLADFAIGMTAAWCYVRVRPRLRARPRPAAALFVGAAATGALVGLLYLSGMGIERGEHNYWGEGPLLAILTPAAFAVALVALPFVPRPLQRPFDNRVARFLGEISYGIFLFHFIALWLVLALVDIPRNGSPESVLLLTALVVPLTIGLAWLGTRFIEEPIRARAARVANRRREQERAANAAPESLPAAA